MSLSFHPNRVGGKWGSSPATDVLFRLLKNQTYPKAGQGPSADHGSAPLDNLDILWHWVTFSMRLASATLHPSRSFAAMLQ
jgi:hypothetical protein